MTSRKPLRADAQRNRETLIARARELFSEGDESLRFDDFAQLAGVGTGTLYRHFPTREALAAAVLQEETSTLSDLARTLGETLTAGKALETFLRRFVDHIDTNQRLARRLAALVATADAATTTAIAHDGDGESGSDAAHSGRELEQAVAELVAAAAQEGAIRDDVPAGAIMMALHGISAAHDRRDWRSEADDVITLLLDGLRIQSPKQRSEQVPAHAPE
ncbi:TetR/AcrR family transcriptional regulator [Plantibacter sp. Mn2098]|uniref:TetR/AcrR family transcriptional regulator n=1 Tax=Plantibacter sp. Mn2098 TaxID=3395266 RepID=UPI003BE82C23